MKPAVEFITDAGAWADTVRHFAQASTLQSYAFALASAHAYAAAKATLLVVRHEEASVAIPLVVRPIPETTWFDAESPGYAGALFEGPLVQTASLWKRVADALAERHVVAAFVRVPPFTPLEPYSSVLLSFEHLTAYVPLEEGIDHAFAGSKYAQHRTKARRAERMGFRVEVLTKPASEQLARFQSLYFSTMKRLGAVEDYYYSQAYFEGLRDAFEDKLVLFFATDAKHQLAYATLMVFDGVTAHYLLGGRQEDVDNTVGNLVFDTAARWAASVGARQLHLGGGTSGTREDALFQFKSRIGRGETSLRAAGVVGVEAAKRELVARWEAQTGQKPRWFLGWRQPVPGVAQESERR